jgi:hypothetical protein
MKWIAPPSMERNLQRFQCFLTSWDGEIARILCEQQPFGLLKSLLSVCDACPFWLPFFSPTGVPIDQGPLKPPAPSEVFSAESPSSFTGPQLGQHFWGFLNDKASSSLPVRILYSFRGTQSCHLVHHQILAEVVLLRVLENFDHCRSKTGATENGPFNL